MGTDFLTSLSDRAELFPSKLHLCSKNTNSTYSTSNFGSCRKICDIFRMLNKVFVTLTLPFVLIPLELDGAFVQRLNHTSTYVFMPNIMFFVSVNRLNWPNMEVIPNRVPLKPLNELNFVICFKNVHRSKYFPTAIMI